MIPEPGDQVLLLQDGSLYKAGARATVTRVAKHDKYPLQYGDVVWLKFSGRDEEGFISINQFDEYFAIMWKANWRITTT